MTDSPKTASDTIASKPANAPVSPPKIPADGAKAADARTEPKPVAAPGLLKT